MGVKVFKPPTQDITVDNSLVQRYKEALRVGKKRCLFRSLLEFDISSLPFFLTIINATMYLYLFENCYPSVPKTLNVHQVLSTWDEKTANFHEPLFNVTPITSMTFTNTNKTFLSFDITTLVTNWYTGRDANLGVLLKMNQELMANLVEFYSKEFENSLYWPYLEVTFLDPASGGGGGQPIELDVNVVTADAIQTAATLNILMFEYTYTILNTGASPATISLQLSPDSIQWYTDEPMQVLLPGQMAALVPNTINKYARLTYQSSNTGQNTKLAIYVRGHS